MSGRILLVQGDNLPRTTLTIKNKADGTDADLSGLTSAVLLFRKKGTLEEPISVPCDIDGSTLSFQFADGVLADAGEYEGEIELNWSGAIQTLYNRLNFRVRAQFG